MTELIPVVLVTGATGFLGGAAVVHLLTSGFQGRIIALVRGESHDHCTQRLKSALERFEPGWGETLPSNLEVLQGELTDTKWGLDPRLEGLTHVLHVAANTSFGTGNDIRTTNVDGALAVARAVSGHKLVRYLHVGTAHIAGIDAPEVVYENEHPDREAGHLVPYTASKAEAEFELLASAGHLPLVVARPSIIVGHTKLGCKPSGSIFWVCRAVDKLRLITWDAGNRVDVIPVDYAAAALIHLLLAPTLKYKRYHISAGAERSISWSEVGKLFAKLKGGPSEDRYRRVPFSAISRSAVRAALGDRHDRHMIKALSLYYRFCGASRIFDNTRLLAEGMPLSPPVSTFLEPCIVSSSQSIYEQMLSDF